MTAYSFATQMDLYAAVDVIYTVVEDHVWRVSSAFPKIDYVYMSAKISGEDRRPLNVGMDGVLQRSETQVFMSHKRDIWIFHQFITNKGVEKVSLCL